MPLLRRPPSFVEAPPRGCDTSLHRHYWSRLLVMHSTIRFQGRGCSSLCGSPRKFSQDELLIAQRIHQRLSHALLKFFAAGDNIYVESIEFVALDFNPGVLVVVGTPHLGGGCRAIPSDLFDRRIEYCIQSKPRITYWHPAPHNAATTVRLEQSLSACFCIPRTHSLLWQAASLSSHGHINEAEIGAGQLREPDCRIPHMRSMP